MEQRKPLLAKLAKLKSWRILEIDGEYRTGGVKKDFLQKRKDFLNQVVFSIKVLVRYSFSDFVQLMLLKSYCCTYFTGYIKNLCNKEIDHLLVIHAHESPSISVPYASKYHN